MLKRKIFVRDSSLLKRETRFTLIELLVNITCF